MTIMPASAAAPSRSTRVVLAVSLLIASSPFLFVQVSDAFLFGTTTSSTTTRPSRSLSKYHATSAGNDDAGTGDVTSALARLDQQWQIQQRQQPQSRWTKILLNDDDDDDTGNSMKEEEVVYLLQPESVSPPSCVVFFVGGAGLGQYPNVAYSEFLQRLSSRLNAAVLTAPYSVGLDHFTLAKQNGKRLQQALVKCKEDGTLLGELPTYCLAHSLGCKLQTIYMAATGQEFDGVGFLSFNNFGFAQTISMARSFAKQLKSNFAGNGMGDDVDASTRNEFETEDLLNTVFDFAESVLGAIGMEFTPSPVDMERIIGLKYPAQESTRLFVFDDDNLDSSRSFHDILNHNNNDEGLTVSALPGQHLSPVYFKIGLEDLPEEVPRDMATEGLGGFESASFGNEDELNVLVDEVSGWILGKDPSRVPLWGIKETWQGQRRIGGTDINDDEY